MSAGISPIRPSTLTQGIAGLVGVQQDMTLVCEASNGREAIQAIPDAPSGHYADRSTDAGHERPLCAHCCSKMNFLTQEPSC